MAGSGVITRPFAMCAPSRSAAESRHEKGTRRGSQVAEGGLHCWSTAWANTPVADSALRVPFYHVSPVALDRLLPPPGNADATEGDDSLREGGERHRALTRVSVQRNPRLEP